MPFPWAVNVSVKVPAAKSFVPGKYVGVRVLVSWNVPSPTAVQA